MRNARENNINRKDIFAFIIGLLGSFQIHFMGTLYLSEIIIIISYLFISVGLFRENKEVRKFSKMALLWLIGAILANIYNSNDMLPSIKGIGNITIFILLIPFGYWLLYDNPSRWLFYAVGAAISKIISFYLFSYDTLFGYERNIWALYACSPIIDITAAILYFRHKHFLAYTLTLAWGFFTLFHNSRNIFLTHSIAIILLIYLDKFKSNSVSENINNYKHQILPLVIIFGVGLVSIDLIYERLAGNGTLGKNAYQKYMMQKDGPGGVMSGRADFLLSFEFAKEKPIFGYGSYALDRFHKTDKYKRKYGIPIFKSNNEYYEDYAHNAIPCHSHLMGHWIWHGILGAIWWLYILILFWRFFKSGAFFVCGETLFLCMLSMCTQTWNILFSPMGGRMSIILLCVYIFLKEDELSLITSGTK